MKTNAQSVKYLCNTNKLKQAQALPTLCNINPRSLYNKVDEFHEFVLNEEVDVVFLSESWERENLKLNEIINLKDFEVIANVSQRTGSGGRPAIVVNKKKFSVKDITNKLVQIPWGVEAVWCILTIKDATSADKVQKIACCSFYCRPGSKKKTELLDHITDTFHLLSKKYGRGLHFAIAGDANELKLDAILSLSPSMCQIVQDYTRMNPPKILDPVITTMSTYYQRPLCLDPLECDSDKQGENSDHKIVLVKPLDSVNVKSARITRKIKVRRFPQSGIDSMKNWLKDYTFTEVFEAVTAHEKAENFQNILLQKLDQFFPEKEVKFSSDDQPWITTKIKKLDRQRKRIYHKYRRSEKWFDLDKQYKKEIKAAKANFYAKTVESLKTGNPRRWYSMLKKISSIDQVKDEKTVVDDIAHLSDEEQAEAIARQFASIQNEYDPLNSEDIKFPSFLESEIPQFHVSEVWQILTKLQTNKATVPGDFPAKLIKLFAAYLAEPLTDIINASVKRGEYPKIYKFEVVTPVPKVHPTQSISQLRSISGLLTFDKVMETLMSRLIISDMTEKNGSKSVWKPTWIVNPTLLS